MTAIIQIRYRQSAGRAYYDRKVAAGKSGKEALLCLKRHISEPPRSTGSADPVGRSLTAVWRWALH